MRFYSPSQRNGVSRIRTHNVTPASNIRSAARELLRVLEKVNDLVDKKDNTAKLFGTLRGIIVGNIKTPPPELKEMLDKSAQVLAHLANLKDEYENLINNASTESINELEAKLKHDEFDDVESMHAYIDPLAELHVPFQKALANAYAAGMFDQRSFASANLRPAHSR